MIEKCKYYSDSQSACSLMIDDMVPVAVSSDGTVSAYNDWGYLMDGPNSLYSYFYEHILKKYPEIKGTIFMPISSPDYIPTDKGYTIYKNQVNSPEFLSFLQRISVHFETAFHGNKHTIGEFESLGKDDLEYIVMSVAEFSKDTGICFHGGKFPAFKYSIPALKILQEIDSKWWALDVSMINEASDKNALIFDKDLNIVLMPTNVCGDIFKNYFIPSQEGLIPFFKNILKFMLGRRNKYSDPIKYLDYLYQNQLPIIIQEHFQSIRTDGNRQTPSIYDDIWSLDLIYAFLRGKDVWYATCNEIAQYYESFMHSTINVIDETNFVVSYNGIYDKPLLSIKLKAPEILHKETMKELHGVFKNEYWIFDNIPTGNYTIIL